MLKNGLYELPLFLWGSIFLLGVVLGNALSQRENQIIIKDDFFLVPADGMRGIHDKSSQPIEMIKMGRSPCRLPLNQIEIITFQGKPYLYGPFYLLRQMESVFKKKSKIKVQISGKSKFFGLCQQSQNIGYGEKI